MAAEPGGEPWLRGAKWAGVVVFNDGFANLNAYATIAGAAPTVVANVMTIPIGTTVQFGSPSWGPINQWRIRFQYQAGATFNFDPHVVDASNFLEVQIFTNQIGLFHVVTGTTHQLALANPALTAGNFYWLTFTQFPSVSGDPPYLQATLYADSAGALGVAVASGSIAAPAFDAVTALSGAPRVNAAAGSALAIGGAFGNVHVMSLFGPGGWLFTLGAGAATAISSGGWEQNTANTYPNGPATSYGAARIDLAPAGTVNAFWTNFIGGAPAGTNAMPVTAPGNIIFAAAYTKSSGLGVAATTSLTGQEWDASGAFLRQTTLQTVTGTQAAWVKLSGSWTTGANCAYASVVLNTIDTNAGASANGTAWFDNVQVWNRTTTGQTAMPYCELRFSQGPSQFLVSGLLGDVSAPAAVLLGTYESSWAVGGSLSLAVGRRSAFHANAVLVGGSNGWYSPVGVQAVQSTAVLDGGSWGGFYTSATINSTNAWNPMAFSAPPATLRGTYHLLQRFLSKEATLSALQIRIFTSVGTQSWFGLGGATTSWMLAEVNGAWLSPVTAANAWLMIDAGQVAIPPEPLGGLSDATQNFATLRAQWVDTTVGGAVQQANWQALLPVDASLLLGVVNNPGNSGWTPSGWVYVYLDGLGVASGGQATATWSVETAALPAPAHGGGGPGTQSSGPVNVNMTADPYLTLDPTLGSNQLVASLADSTGAVLPLAVDILYTPLYLEPR